MSSCASKPNCNAAPARRPPPPKHPPRRRTMALRSDGTHWGSLAKTLHWLMALLIIGAAFVGWYMTDLPLSPQKVKIYALHKSTGLTILALALLRLAWR